MAMTSAQALMAEGRKEGREEGQEQGRRQLLFDLLEAKFGPLPPSVASVVEAWAPERVRDAARRVLTAQALADLQLEV